jgi:hypothetical protein
MADSQRGIDLETKAARQSHYIKWTRIMGIPDLCGQHKGYQRVMAIYTKFLQSGIDYYNKNNLQSAMLVDTQQQSTRSSSSENKNCRLTSVT